MWCCKYGKEQASGTPTLDPKVYEMDMLSGFVTYWCDHINKPVLIKAADDTSHSDVTAQTEEPPGDLPAPNVSSPSASATSASAADGPAADESTKPIIPRIWHVMVASWSDVDLTLKHNILDIRRRSPAFQLIIWTHANVCEWMDAYADERVPCCFYRMNSEYGAARADLWRYYILYTFGGIWTDHKASLSLSGGWNEMLQRLPQPNPPIIFATKQNLW